MDALKKQWEAGKDVNWSDAPSTHVVAGLLMMWLLELPEPLITFDLYDSLIAAEGSLVVVVVLMLLLLLLFAAAVC